MKVKCPKCRNKTLRIEYIYEKTEGREDKVYKPKAECSVCEYKKQL